MSEMLIKAGTKEYLSRTIKVLNKTQLNTLSCFGKGFNVIGKATITIKEAV